MDYTKQSIGFKSKKALRYISLYGVSRTWIKIQGQYHMKKQYKTLPIISAQKAPGRHVGMIGCGNYAFSNIAYYLRKNYGNVITAAMDVDIHKAASLYEKYRLNYYTDDAMRIMDDPAIDIVYIASNHASHAEYAIQALERGKHVHIEKPHVVNEDQLIRLCSAMKKSEGKVSLGFNRPHSPMGCLIKAALNSQTGASMLNWFVAGHEIAPEHWYFRQEEGGRVLGNLCHWTDFVYQMVDPDKRYPLRINPTRSEKSDCDIAVTYTFGDGSISVITFSAKGHTFEGVRERFSAHRGNVLVSLDDFKSLVIENVDKKRIYRNRVRNHGHEGSIMNSYRMTSRGNHRNNGCTVSYIWETGQLFLKTKESLERNEALILDKHLW
jgi:predicted dehydrogenase